VFASPIAAWQPVVGASKYQVELSPSLYPWRATKRVGAPATSVVLPITKFNAGVWYYRMRGYDDAPPAGARAMSWSTPIRLQVTGNRVAIVSSQPAPATVKAIDRPTLLKRVRQAYKPVPGVLATVHTASFSVRFTMMLRAGRVVAEQSVSQNHSGTTTLVTRGSTTFGRAPGKSCWTISRPPGQLKEIGIAYPGDPGMKAIGSQKTATGWLLKVGFAGAGSLSNLAVDGGSSLLKSAVLNSHGRRYLEHITSLRSAPKLAVPEPRC